MESEEEEIREVERRAFENVRINSAALKAQYRARFGNEIATDNAREIVSSEYAASLEARTRFSGATQKPAGLLADQLFEDALANPDLSRRKVVVFTAGGTGAGKTTALHAAPGLWENAQFVYDSNLGSKRSSILKIEAAKASGNRVDVLFVHRDPIRALTQGVLPRAMYEGRVVNLDAHARMYRDAAENFAYLVRKYSRDEQVEFHAFDNSGGPQDVRLMQLEHVVKIRYSTNELRPKLRAALEQEYAERRISEAVYRATLGASSAEATRGVARDN